MKALIGTPCGQGNVKSQYLVSLLDTMNKSMAHKGQVYNDIVSQIPNFDQNNPHHAQTVAHLMHKHTVDIQLYTLSGESLLQRGRNHIAAVALSSAADKLFFIDADTQWTWEQFYKIAMSDKDICCGMVPLKTYPISLNFLPYVEDEVFFENGVRSYAGTMAMAKKHGSDLIRVPFVGTAFMCIDTKVLISMSETADTFLYPDPYTGQSQSHWDFFKVQAIKNTYLSEDWSFVYRASEIGFATYIDTTVVLGHVGDHTFRAV